MQMGQRSRTVLLMTIDYGKAKDSEKKALVNGILKADDANGVPKNDLGVFMSEDTSPEVREFMKNYLLKDSSGLSDSDAKISANDLAKLSDNDISSILDSMPNRGETLNQYEARIQKYLSDEKEERERIARQRKRDKDLEELFNNGKSSN